MYYSEVINGLIGNMNNTSMHFEYTVSININGKNNIHLFFYSFFLFKYCFEDIFKSKLFFNFEIKWRRKKDFEVKQDERKTRSLIRQRV